MLDKFLTDEDIGSRVNTDVVPHMNAQNSADTTYEQGVGKFEEKGTKKHNCN